MNERREEDHQDRASRVRSLIAGARSQALRANRERLSTADGVDPLLSESAAPDDHVPPRIPGYELIREVHRGGQGVVFEAMQRSTQRRVAVKVTREGPFAGPSESARFEREVRTLAQLSHPNIVAIHDSGRVAGHDYFVMDFIDGRPLDRFVLDDDGAKEPGGTTLKLGVPEIVRLFVKVCDGVNAAHLRGVIHRDLKPGNILVDASGEPRILDFGLAKHSGPAVEGAARPMTQTGQFVGSLPWTSPEQACGADVDVRTDVYSLGVILYQCLTGRFPYPITGPATEVLESIRVREPLRPRSLHRNLDADLETIVLKCLAKQRERRYQSAGELGKDLTRCLRGEAIEARRDSALYVLRKTLRRYRLATAVTAAMVATVALFGATMAVQSGRVARERDRAERERGRAERVEAFLQSMFESVAPEGVPAAEVSVRSVLDDGARRVDAEFADWPEEAASIHETLGETYRKLGFFSEAEANWRRCLALRTEVLGAEHPIVARTLGRLAMTVFDKQDLAEAERLFRKAIAVGERVLGAEDADVVRWSVELASLLVECKRFAEGEAIARHAMELGERLFGKDHSSVVVARLVVGRSLNETGQSEEALAMLDAAADGASRTDERGRFAFEAALMFQAEVYERLGRVDEAEQSLRKVIEVRRERLGEEHPALAWNLLCLARLLLDCRADAEAAEPLARQALAIQRVRKGPDHIDTADCQKLLARILMARNDFEIVEVLLRENLRIRLLVTDSAGELADARALLADCLEARGELEEARQVRAARTTDVP